MPIPENFIQSGLDKIFSSRQQEEEQPLEVIPKEEAEKSGLFENLVHLGGKLPGFLKDKITDVKDVVKEKVGNVIDTITETREEENSIAPGLPRSTDEVSTDEISEVSLKSEDMDLLGGIVFGESRPYQSVSDEELKEEMRSIVNIALNRVKETGETLQEVLTKKDQFRAFQDKKQFDRFGASDQDEFEKRKSELVTDILNELQSGSLEDNTNGANSFEHFDEDGERKFRTFTQKLDVAI